MKRNALACCLFAAAAAGIALPLYLPTIVKAQSGVSWITVRDGREQAFSIEVPKGWKVYGGMFRCGIVDARPMVDMTSPDGMKNMRVGDATIPGYSTPNPWIPSQARGPRIAPYASGDVFSARYGQARFASMCQNVQVHESHAMDPKYHSTGFGTVHVTGGETIFTCSEKGQPMLGYAYAETMLVGRGGPNSSWYVVTLASFLAPLSQGQAVGDMLKHSGESLQMNPAWAKEQHDIIAEQTQKMLGIAHATAQATQQMNEHQEQWNKMMRSENDSFNDILNGVTFTRDPTTGQTGEVQTLQGGPIWTNGHNVVSSAMTPGDAYHELQPVSR